MNVATIEAGTRAATGGDRWNALRTIAEDRIALAVWRRELPTGLATLDIPEGLSTMRVIASLDTLVDDLPGALRQAGHRDPIIEPLASDIATIAAFHAEAAADERIAIRLEPIKTDACRRFHSDMVRLRTICTYVGPGTEWHPVGSDDAVERIATGAVALFKGRRLLDEPLVLHRSPPIERDGGRRLVLVVDTADARAREMYAPDPDPA